MVRYWKFRNTNTTLHTAVKLMKNTKQNIKIQTVEKPFMKYMVPPTKNYPYWYYNGPWDIMHQPEKKA
jgi:hypothetical protein